jgi:Nucleosome binding factor SPN, SPT16 subunit
VRARITAVADGLAWAELLSPVDQAEPPLTAEAEAERPTRAPRKSAAAKAEEDIAEEDEADEDVVEEELEDETDVESTPAAASAKKKTRRGSRGGRNRKKKTATAASPNGAEPETVPGTDLVPGTSDETPAEGPVIHVPRAPPRRMATHLRRPRPRSAPGAARVAGGTARRRPRPLLQARLWSRSRRRRTSRPPRRPPRRTAMAMATGVTRRCRSGISAMSSVGRYTFGASRA